MQSLYFASVVLNYVKEYKYLGFTLEYMNYETAIKILADSNGRALGWVVNKLKMCKDLG